MKILLTGASGFVGGALVEKLLLEKDDVKNFKGRLQYEEAVKKQVGGVDVVFNCAAVLPHHKKPESDYWDANVTGVENICKAALGANAKLVHVSTVGIFGAGPKIITESSKVRISDIYTKTKYEGDKIVQKYNQKGLKAVIIRPTIGYGPRDIRPGFIDLFRFVKKGLFVPVGNGENYLHTIYIDNLIDGLVLAMRKRGAIGEDFIIGDDPAPKMSDITSEIYKAVGRRYPSYYIPKSVAIVTAGMMEVGNKVGLPAPLNLRRVRFITESRRYSTAKARKVLGYRPKVCLEKGVKLTYKWYLQNKLI